ncbi:MAG: galactokinase [Candidatus Izimaplasma sp.]|nr:galactokinase [Candidatus Izimaplasma bacterium]
MTLKKLKEMYQSSQFLTSDVTEYFVPGRVNLIGEHIDYHGGRVLPTSIDLGTYVLLSPREDQTFHLVSENYSDTGIIKVTLDNLTYDYKRGWANFFTGVLAELLKLNYRPKNGLNIVVYGTLPTGAGLSSSASLQLVLGLALCDQFDFKLSRIELIKLTKRVENDYMHVNSGIMDQFACYMSKNNQGTYLNTTTLNVEYVPINLGQYTLIIANSNKERTLANSAYNERVEECQTALKIISKTYLSIDRLTDLNKSDLPNIKTLLEDTILYKRVKHVVMENQRVKEAVKALKSQDIIRFGELLTASHNSLDTLYDVSSYELNTLTHLFNENGAIGSRLTGAGFGGCVIALMKTDNTLKQTLAHIKKHYKLKTNKTTDIFKTKLGIEPKIIRRLS